MFLDEREPPPPRPMADRPGTSAGTVPCPKCGRTVNARAGTPGWVIAECPACLNTLVATNTLVTPPAGGGLPQAAGPR